MMIMWTKDGRRIAVLEDGREIVIGRVWVKRKVKAHGRAFNVGIKRLCPPRPEPPNRGVM